MMEDKSLDILLVIFFSLSGIVILTLAWLRPMVLPERVLAIFFGSGGLLFALARVTRFRSRETAEQTELSLEVEVENK